MTDPSSARSGAPDLERVASRSGSRRTLTWLVLGSLFFGGVLAFLRGQGGAGLTQLEVLRSFVGNLGAPWFVLPVLAGSLTRRWLPASAKCIDRPRKTPELILGRRKGAPLADRSEHRSAREGWSCYQSRLKQRD